MACKRCSSDLQGKFGVEMNFHFPGYEGLDRPPVLVFPMVLVCFNCGFGEFTLPEDKLSTLEKGNNAS